VEYGKAGDCYSLTECPQGRFSIDLRGTSLGLSPEITWIKETSSAFIAINRIVSNSFLREKVITTRDLSMSHISNLTFLTFILYCFLLFYISHTLTYNIK